MYHDVGLSFGDHINKTSPFPKRYGWATLPTKDGDEQGVHYRYLLETPGIEKGMLGVSKILLLAF